MGTYFGIRDNEDLYIWEVADMALVAPLPPGWSEVHSDAAAARSEGVPPAPELQFKCVGDCML